MIKNGINRRDLDRLLRDLGGDHEIAHATGDVVYSHPRLTYRARANCRRKDASRALVLFVRDLERTLGAAR
jgi:hypothetical protein